MTDHDELMRLADIAERLDRVHSLLELSQEQKCRQSMAAKVDYASSALLGAQFALTELRATLTLAQGAKTGGVAALASIQWVGQVRPSTDKHGGACVTMDWDEFNAMRIAAGLNPQPPAIRRPPPAAQHEGSAVDDAMVERALTAWFHDDPWTAVQAEFEDGGDRFRSDMRAALTAALAPQPKTEDTPK